MAEERTTVCNRDCPDACAIVATVDGDRVIKLGGDRTHPVTRGFLCYRTNQYLQTQYSKERLKRPLVRKSGVLTEVSWDEALDFTAERLVQIRAESGPASILHYASGGSLGLLKKVVAHFFELFGPVTTKRGDICSGAGEAAQELDFGISDSSDLFDLLNAKEIVVWGKNLYTSSPHTLMVVKDAKARGTTVTLIDPVSQRTRDVADRFIQPRPGGDFAFAMAVALRLFEGGGIDEAAASYCDGLAAFESLVRSKSLACWCAEADVPLDDAAFLAERLAAAKPASILVGWGMARRQNGGAIVRALDALAAISGNIGVPGACVSYYFRRRAAFDTSFAAGSAARTLSEPLLGEAILGAKEPPIRAVWITAGNPVAMLPDSHAVKRALESRDFVVVVDPFLTDTAKLATVVLPTTTLLEADDLLGAYGHHTLGVAKPVIAPPDGILSDVEIAHAIAQRVGLGEALAGSARDWKAKMVSGRLKAHGVSLDDLERAPLRNPMAPPVLFAGRKFPTPSGRVNLMTAAAAPPPAVSDAFPMLLASLSTPRSQSSQWAAPPALPLEVVVHPERSAGLKDGELGVLSSALGSMPVRVRLDERQRRDVALLPKGGHLSDGAAANALIHAKLTDLGEGGALYDEPVRLSRT